MSSKPEETVAQTTIQPLEKQLETTPNLTDKKENSNPSGKKTEEPTTSTEKNIEADNVDKRIEDTTAALASTTIAPLEPADGTTTAPTDTKEAPTNSITSPTWPETGPEHPLTKFFDLVPDLIKEAQHAEVYGIELSQASPFHTKLILQKFLRANSNDLQKAKEQLLDTLKWRREFDPIAVAKASYSAERFGGLGYICEITNVPGSVNKKDVVTFNIYGAVKDNKKTFGDLEEFLRWRVGLMERSVQKLNLKEATKPIPDFGTGQDPYQGYQIHDYLQVSFIRQDPLVKAATKKTIATLSRYYPETLSRKFFVNVPVLMGWVYSAMKLIVAKETAKKFTVLSYGKDLGAELGPGAPKEYGGSAGALKEVGEGMRFE